MLSCYVSIKCSFDAEFINWLGLASKMDGDCVFGLTFVLLGAGMKSSGDCKQVAKRIQSSVSNQVRRMFERALDLEAVEVCAR